MSIFFTSIATLLIATVCNMAIHLIALIRQPTTPFVLLLAADFVLSSVRITILFRTRRAAAKGKLLAPDDFIVTGIVWTALVGVGTALCAASRDPVLQFLAPTTMMGIVAGLVTRNNCAPRLALLQVGLCDIPLQFALPFCGQPWMLFSIAQCPLLMAAMARTIFDISHAYLAMVMAKRESEERAIHDPLTGLWNRSGLMSALARRASDPLPSDGPFALLYIDLDRFKAVNDELGHAAGDELLRQAAIRILDVVPEKSMVARLGGDEFVVAVTDIGETAGVALGEVLIAAVSQPYRLGALEVPPIGASVGVAWSLPGQAPEELLAEADAALYRAKRRGKGCCVMAETRGTTQRPGQRAA